ncbi:hypothetical protein [Fusobacterium polymorphum]|uniref:hypothetical protein n=1 Tax=Fusobacterium nucleatum subsp. polymorphum TaxID=76857 RepID=UPI0030CCC595
MSDYTKYLRLIKPSGNEYYDVENFNHNAELIDKETEDLSNKVAKIQEGATREKAGIVQFGTEEGKALEGMMLARLAGCVGYGGDIQELGVKDVNYIYYDRNTRKMYKCLNQNSDVSANVANFIPLDNNSLLDRLENFIKVKNNKIFTIGNICIETINCIPNTAGIRTVNVESDFKNIFSIFLTGYITEGQTGEHLMRQVVHDYYSKIVATKQVKLYASGNQSLELTIIGTI